MPTPEELARINIDKQLIASGWIIQDVSVLNRYASLGVAVREFALDTGETDYLLFADGKAVGAIAQAAKELVEQRERWLNAECLNESEKKKRTLTNLYNARPTWLELAHKKLDEAVFVAYGWISDWTDGRSGKAAGADFGSGESCGSLDKVI